MGEPRTTPIGTPLSGVWRESYWTSGDIAKGARPGDGLADALDGRLDQLSKYRNYFQHIRSEGGRTEFFIV
ncbi:MAG: hypothetical protein KGJ78_02565 [Alphaproteobacteria bacterium]|nr:hypothetical protein [Alphaproteobacteria bacterium]